MEIKPEENALISVFSRKTDPDSYPEGLANSIHFALETKDTGKVPFNKNYGILFEEGLVSEQNTIIPMGIRNPGIFYMENGWIAVIAERIHESGDADEKSKGKVLLWKTTDLIHFEYTGFADRQLLASYSISDTLAVKRELAETALRYWSPIVYTEAEVPEEIIAKNENELEKADAVLHYSDGSERRKKVNWDKTSVHFDQPGIYHVKGTITQQHFSFPLAEGYGDPVIFRWEGKWYYISTNDNRNDIGLYVREARNIEDLFREGATEHLILPFCPEKGFEQTFWAPEFHVIGDELYILFAVSGHTWGPQCHMMKKKKGRGITEPDAWETPVRVIRKDGSFLADEAITLDMTYIKALSGSYVVWSYREHIGTSLDSGSMLYIASVDDGKPWQLTSDPVLLTRPLYGWENVSGTINNEGPCSFQRDGTVYLTYSGGSANRYTYALGLLTADSRSNLLELKSWKKSITPVLTFYSVDGEYGPGHNSFFVNQENELMISYHAEKGLKETLRCDGIRRVHFREDLTPYFGMASHDDLMQETVSTRVIVEK